MKKGAGVYSLNNQVFQYLNRGSLNGASGVPFFMTDFITYNFLGKLVMKI